MPRIMRSRWAAIGAAVAVSLGAGVIHVARAEIGSGDRAVFVPIAPCRLFDTRAGQEVGPRSTPLGPGETYTQQVTGSNGNCVLPGDATAVAMNVTAVGPSAPAFLTLWPADVSQPLASNLNYVAGAPPTPNKVDVKLSAAGAVNLFNSNGTVDVLADVVGFYTNHNHDDRYYTQAEVDSLVAAIPAGPTGPPGPAGTAGATGAQGPTGVGTANLGYAVTTPPGATDGVDATDVAIGIDGLPIIALSINGTLRAAHCADTACRSSTIEVLDKVSNVLNRNPEVVVGQDGFPLVVQQGAAVTVRITHCQDVVCTSATSNNIGSGEDPTIAIGADGLGIIAMRVSSDLVVVHCSNVPCSSATQVVADDGGADFVGYDPSIAIGSDGLPIISHSNGTKSALRVTHCNNTLCSAATSTTLDDIADSVGGQSSIVIGTDDLPIVAHRNFSQGNLRVSHCVNVTCTALSNSSDVDTSVNFVGAAPEAALGSDGMLLVVHTDATASRARVTHCSNVTCTAASSSHAAGGSVEPRIPSVAIGADGLPVLAYGLNVIDPTPLTIVHCSNRTCVPYARD